MISIIIPVKNGALTLGRCLDSIKKQTAAPIEIIVLDSMSSDNSREIALEFNATVIDIPEGTFDHGLTRNIGVSNASGDLLFYTVQDAWLSDNSLLEKMQGHFLDGTIMGVVGHQVVPSDKDTNPAYWYKRFTEPENVLRKINDWPAFEALDQNKQRELINWDNVVAMYRKTALIEQPFVATEFAEDWIWCRDALKNGWSVIYDPSLIVYHYHHYTFQYSYKVSFALNYHLQKHFNHLPKVAPFFLPLAKIIFHLIKNPGLDWKEKFYWGWHNFMDKSGNFMSTIDYRICNLTGGIQSVERRYYKICKTIPQGKQKI